MRWIFLVLIHLHFFDMHLFKLSWTRSVISLDFFARVTCGCCGGREEAMCGGLTFGKESLREVEAQGEKNN